MGAPQRPRATFYLVIREGTEAEQVVVWDTVDITVGRRDHCDLVIEDSDVSREHARFHRRGDDCVVEDLDTGLGTWVNGERTSRHELQHGDVVRVGTVEIRFGRTTEKIKRASNVSHASELKDFGLVTSDDAAGRTMLAFDTHDDVPATTPAPVQRQARAVTLDGDVDLADPDSTAMDIGLPAAEEGLAEGGVVRDLDVELARDLPPIGETPVPEHDPSGGSSTAPTLIQAADTAPPLANTAVMPAEANVKLVLEVVGPADQVETFLAAIRDKRIAVPPLTLLIRDI